MGKVTKKVAVKLSDVNPLELTKKDFVIDKTGMKITAVAGLYKDKRPEELTDAVEKLVDDYRSDFVASVAAVGGQLAIDKLIKTKADQATVVAGMFGRGNSVTTRIRGERTFDTAKGKAIIPGYSSLSIRTAYSKKRGVIKSSSEFLTETARKRKLKK